MAMINLHIDDETHAEVKRVAIEQGISMRTAIHEALDEWIRAHRPTQPVLGADPASSPP